ncbi:YidC/Oxa1 family membrane protein insertase, partial [Candidatus Kaiserbacteria bacterium]|nr:YidC/Oxa1 family membrane protein insertase [Candidatus Kaiserbacteria bacterium]
TVSMLMFGVFDIAAKSLPLAVLAGVTMFIQMKLTMPPLPPREEGAELDHKQEFMRSMQLQMKYVMPVLIGFVAYSFSASIALYFVVSNLTAIGQEYWVRKHR